MVNTFITSKSFVKSAKNLDWRRLGKQRVEAYQILLILQDYHLIGRLLKLKNFEDIKKGYKEHPYCILQKRDTGKYYRMNKKHKHLYKHIKKDYRMVLQGFIHHPIVKMWYGYEKALKCYINCMIDEWIARGYKNNMLKYEGVDEDTIVKPKWVFDKNFRISHKVSLLYKEMDRNEKRWYWDKPNFVKYKDVENKYVWY